MVGLLRCGVARPLRASAAIFESLSATKSKITVASLRGELADRRLTTFGSPDNEEPLEVSADLRFRFVGSDLSPLDIIRFNVEFQRFLMALSVRPGSSFAISAHLLPRCAWVSTMI